MRGALSISLSLLAFSAADAATIYQNGPPASEKRPVDGMKSDTKPGSVSEGSASAQWTASPFSITTSETVQALTFEGLYKPYPIPPPTDDFQIVFFRNDGSLPGEPIGSILGSSRVNRLSTGVTFEGNMVYRYEVDLSAPITLEPGSYWLAVIHTSTYEDCAFFWAQSDENTPIAFSQSGVTGTYYPWGGTLYFTLESARFVPEPASALLGAGSAMLLLFRRRR